MSEFHKRSLSQSHINVRVIKVQDTTSSTDKLNSQSSDNCIYSMVKKNSENSINQNPKSFSSYSLHKKSTASCDFEDIDEDSACKPLHMNSGDIVLSGSVKYTPVTTPLTSSCHKSAFNFSPDTSSSEQTPKLVREKAKEYRKIRGKNLFSTIEESSSNAEILSNSITDANILLPPPPMLHSVNSDLSIQKIIVVQSIIRKHLTMKRIKEKEEFRVRYRTVLERNCEKTYKIKIDKIEDELRNGLKCKEYDEAVEQVKEYVTDVLKDPMDVSDYKTKIQYLFSLCDEKQQGCLEEEQFLVLTQQIMKLTVPKSSYEHLFSEENKIYCDFERFYRWFNRIYIIFIFILKKIDRKEKGVKSNGLFRQISGLFSDKKIYPYMCHIKCVLHEELVTSKLKQYDIDNPPQFQCPICCKVYINPLKLSKHIVQCNYDNFVVSNSN